jgi:hypothetical protein
MRFNNPKFYRGALALLVFTGVLVAERAASAQIFVGDGIYAFTTQASYNAASLPYDTVQFDASVASQSGFTTYGDPGTLSVGDVSFTTPAGTDLFVVGPGYDSPNYNFPGDGTATLLAHGAMIGEDASLTAALPTNYLFGVSAVGTQIASTFETTTVMATVTLTDGMKEVYTYAAPNGQSGLGFLGFVSTGGNTIESVTYTELPINGGDFPNLTLDNFTYGVTTFVPEPSAIPLLGVGAIALLLFRRRLASV